MGSNPSPGVNTLLLSSAKEHFKKRILQRNNWHYLFCLNKFEKICSVLGNQCWFLGSWAVEGVFKMEKITCDYCGTEKGRALIHRCKECGQNHCILHKIPERHGCPSVNIVSKWSPIGPPTHQSKPQDIIISTSKSKEEPEKTSKGFFSWLRGKSPKKED